MTAKELQLLIDLRQRVENEDWLGTCGDSEQAAELEREHHEMLARIDAVLRRHGKPSPSQGTGNRIQSGRPRRQVVSVV